MSFVGRKVEVEVFEVVEVAGVVGVVGVGFEVVVEVI